LPPGEFADDFFKGEVRTLNTYSLPEKPGDRNSLAECKSECVWRLWQHSAELLRGDGNSLDFYLEARAGKAGDADRRTRRCFLREVFLEYFVHRVELANDIRHKNRHF